MKKLINKYNSLKKDNNDYLIRRNKINYYKKKKLIHINNNNKDFIININKIIYYTENILILDNNNTIEITVETYKYLNEVFEILSN